MLICDWVDPRVVYVDPYVVVVGGDGRIVVGIVEGIVEGIVVCIAVCSVILSFFSL